MVNAQSHLPAGKVASSCCEPSVTLSSRLTRYSGAGPRDGETALMPPRHRSNVCRLAVTLTAGLLLRDVRSACGAQPAAAPYTSQ